MLAHTLRHKIEIYEKVKTKNSIGAMTETEVLIDSVYAEMQTSMGRAATNDDRVVYSTETNFIFRNHPVMNYNYFIKHNGEKYLIMGIQQISDRSGQIIKTILKN